jgi:hypothetical protein
MLGSGPAPEPTRVLGCTPSMGSGFMPEPMSSKELGSGRSRSPSSLGVGFKLPCSSPLLCPSAALGAQNTKPELKECSCWVYFEEIFLVHRKGV